MQPAIQRIIGACLFLSLFYNTLSAQLTGHVNYEQAGIEFDIPEGWFGQEGDGVIILGSYQTPGRILIYQHEYNKAQLIEQAKLPIADSYGTNLNLQGELTDLASNAIGGLFVGTMEFQPAKAYIVGVANPYSGYGVTIAAATTVDQYGPAYENLAKKVYKSFKFKKIAAANSNTASTPTNANAGATGAKKEWVDWLNNTRLTYLYYYGSGGSGDSDEIRIDLCSAGYFNYMRNGYTIISGDGYSGHNQSNGRGSGTWQLKNARTNDCVLVLNFNSGEVKEYNMSYEDKKLYLNGNRYYRTRSGEETPNCN